MDPGHLGRGIVVASLALAGCHRGPPPAGGPAPVAAPPPAVAACPAPDLGQVLWDRVDDSSGFVLALPPGFEERPSGGPFRHWQAPGDFQQSMTFGLIRGDAGLASYRRPYQSALMQEYSICTDTVSGYEVSIQAWRTPDGVYRKLRRLDRYDVFAIWKVRPGLYAYLSGGSYDVSMQMTMLGAVRAWRAR